MPRSPEDNRQIRDARREAIVAAAAEVFAKKGYGHAKIADIATAAGLSHGLVYHYFRSKDEVFAAIVEAAMATIREDLTGDAPTPLAAIERVVDRALERVAGAPHIGLLLSQVMLLGGIPDDVRVAMTKDAAQIRHQWIELLRKGQRRGEITRDSSAEELATVLLCALRGLAILSHARCMGGPEMDELDMKVPSRETLLRFLLPGTTSAASPRPQVAKARSKRAAGEGRRR
ncbi:MAG: TetR/AcrR family transcriptional regulator [Sandaracinaceae bacterium]